MKHRSQRNMDYNQELAITNGFSHDAQFHLPVDMMNNAGKFYSPITYVGGQPYYFEVCRTRTGASLYMNLMNYNKQEHWAVIVSVTITLMSFKRDGPFLQKNFDMVFTSQILSTGYPEFVPFSVLCNPANGYINAYGHCMIEVKIHAGQFQDLTENNGMHLQTLRQCCDGSSNGKFRLTIDDSIQFFGVCSPTFSLCNMPWRLSVVKSQFHSEQTKNFILRIFAQNLFKQTATNWSCQATMACKLVTSDPNIQSISHSININLGSMSVTSYLDLAFWQTLKNPETRFIQNNKFIIEVDLQVQETKGIDANSGKQCCLNNFGMECAVCFESVLNRPVACTKCGHLFCKQCIEGAVRRFGFCPTCNQAAEISDLRTMYLPFI